VRAARPLLAAIAFAALLAVPAHGESTREGNLIASFNAELVPKTLPRRALAPIAVTVAGGIRGIEGAPLPQLRRIVVAINSQGQLFDRGLAVCEVSAIQPATEHTARRRCAGAIVGSGRVSVQAHLPTQSPFAVNARLLAFNGPRRKGRKLIFAQVYAEDPPGAFVLTFAVRRRPGLFGTTMSTTLPRSAWEWAYLTHFEMTLKRTYTYRGVRRSYVSAACRAPAGLLGAVFPFARATYGFDDGRSVTTTAVRSCRVRAP
jgi:hypothetical protein